MAACKFSEHLIQFHNGEDPQKFVSIKILEECQSLEEAKEKELIWSFKLFSFYPNGLNVREEKNVVGQTTNTVGPTNAIGPTNPFATPQTQPQPSSHIVLSTQRNNTTPNLAPSLSTQNSVQADSHLHPRTLRRRSDLRTPLRYRK